MVSQERPTQNKAKSPSQYDEVPSELLAEILESKALPLDRKKQESAIAKRKAITQAVLRKEFKREKEKGKVYEQLYADLPRDKKDIFSQRLAETVEQISEYVTGKKSLDGLSGEDQFILGKLQNAFDKFKKENPGQEFKPAFDKEIDRKVFDNFQYKLAFESFRDMEEQGDSKKAGDILASIQKEQIVDDPEIEAYFLATAERGLRGNIDQIRVYDERIQTLKNGKALRSEDNMDSLLASFEQATRGTKWTDDFDIEVFKEEKINQRMIGEKAQPFLRKMKLITTFASYWGLFSGKDLQEFPDYASISEEFSNNLDNIKDLQSPTNEEFGKITTAFLTLADYAIKHGKKNEIEQDPNYIMFKKIIAREKI
ncbi:MAG: hypothetical protein WCK16_02175 [Candidatus Moraniibacteriota bacterium]